MIPAHREVINGRTWDREWQPIAIEHYRAPLADRVCSVVGWLAACAAIGICLAQGL